jgi:scramblase
MEDPFDFQALWVMQPGHLPTSRAKYQIFSGDRELLANAADTARRSWLPDVLKSIPNASVLEIVTATGVPLLTMIMRHTEWATELRDPAGALVGTIQMGDTRRQYKLLDESGKTVGKVVGDLGLKNFSITDIGGSKLALVRKTRAGLFKEMLTSNDHYKVEFIGPVVQHPVRTLTAMVPIVLDLVLYEPK